jgi:hypothetical protein
MVTHEIKPNLVRKVEDLAADNASSGHLEPREGPDETQDQRLDDEASLRMVDEGCPNCGS